MGCPFLSIILEVDLLSPHNFSSAQKDPSKVRCEDGVLGAPENSSSVRKPSGTCLAHHRVWGTAKDPTVIQVTSQYEIAKLIALVAVISATAPAIEKGLAEKRTHEGNNHHHQQPEEKDQEKESFQKLRCKTFLVDEIPPYPVTCALLWSEHHLESPADPGQDSSHQSC
ncbi:hypothetical protein TURU_086157 [Turdus rufiventris]|nr:hypothetical protein TURU_086157 [Turdus rufiventris]